MGDSALARLSWTATMPEKPTTVSQYLAALPPERRAALETVRRVIMKNLDKDYEEGIQYGMIGYYVPHRVFPAGYHCDPKQPLPFAGIASRKGYMTIAIMGLYMFPGGDGWFREAWKKTGKKLDMGAACIRFKKVDDLALELIGKTVKDLTVKKFVATYQAALDGRGKGRPAKKPVKKAARKVK
jgi:hypothetical protein